MKNKIKIITAFILGVLITSATVYAAITAFAGNIRFTPSDEEWNVSNVSEALEDLYDLAGENTYGVRRKVDSSSSEWERIGKSTELIANAQVGESSVRNDFDDIYPWSDIKSYNYDTDNNEITAWYGEEDFSFKPAGNVEVLTYIPEFYYSRYQRDGYEYILISKNERKYFTKSDAFSVGRYTMSVDPTNSNRVHSKSGANPLGNKTITQFRDLAKNLGEGFQQLDYHIFIIQLLYLVEYADYDSQVKLGLGNTNNDKIIASGGCDILGMHSGSVDGTDKTSMIYRGIEDIYGNIWQWVDGINNKDYCSYINYNPSTYAVDTFSNNYVRVNYVNSSVRGYPTIIGYDASNELVMFPIETVESGASLFDDHYQHYSGNRITAVGGRWDSKSGAGLWDWSLIDASSTSSSVVTSRLLKIN